MPADDLRRRREEVVREHVESENVHDFDIGTHLGPLRALPPTGRSFRCRMTAFFRFEDDRLVCERVYFDQATIMRQLGLLHAPDSLAGRATALLSHPVTIGRAVLRGIRG